MSIIIIGAGEIGYHIANELSLENRDVTLIDPDRERIRFLEESGEDLNIICGSGSNPENLKRAGIEKAEMLIAVANNDEINITACYLASQMNKDIKKIARIRDIDTHYYGSLIKGNPPIIDSIINPEELCAYKIANLTKYPIASDLNYFFDKKAVLIGIHVVGNNPLIGKTLIELGKDRKNNNYKALIASIIHEDKAIVPSGEDVVCEGDIIYIVTLSNEIDRIIKYVTHDDATEVKNVTIYGGSNIGFYIARAFEKESKSIFEFENAEANTGTNTNIVLPSYKYKIKLIEADTQRSEFLSDNLPKTLVLKGNVLEKAIFENERIDESDVFIAATNDQEENIISTLYAKSNGVKKGIAVLKRRNIASLVKNLGIDAGIFPQQVAVAKIFESIRKGKILSIILLNQNDIEVDEIQALKGSRLIDIPLKDVKLPKGTLVIAIEKQNGEVLIPFGESVIKAGDKVAIITRKTSVKALEKFTSN